MPLTKTGKKVKAAMTKEYGAKKGEQVFYATMNKYGKQWHKSPDSYEDAGDAGAPSRKSYHAKPDNVNASAAPQRAGGTPAKVEGNDGTENRRANYKTKSASVPEPGKGSNRWGAVDSYNDSGELP